MCSCFSDTHGTRSRGLREPKPLSPCPLATRCALGNAASTLQTRTTAPASDTRWQLRTHPAFEGIRTQGFALRSFLSLPVSSPTGRKLTRLGFFTNSQKKICHRKHASTDILRQKRCRFLNCSQHIMEIHSQGLLNMGIID